MNPARGARQHTLSVDGSTEAQDVRAAIATHRLYGLSETDARAIVRQVVAAVRRWPQEASAAGISETERRIVGSAFAAIEPAADLVATK